MNLRVASRLVPNNLGLKILEHEELLRLFSLVFIDLMIRELELVNPGFELVTRGFSLTLLSFNSSFSAFNSCC